MTDYDIDELVLGAAPTDEAVASPSLAPVMADLREQIMETDTVRPRQHADVTKLAQGGTRRRPRRRYRLIGASAAAAVLAVVAVVVGVGDDSSSAYAAEVVAVAEASPRLLIGNEGWQVTRADELNAEQGEMTFEQGARSADLHWRPADTHVEFVEDRRDGSDLEEPVVIAGDEGVLFRYAGTDTFTALWLRGEHSLELRIDGTSENEFRRVADTVQAVSVETWLDALPESVVRPADRSDAVTEMLTGLPIPDSFDRSALDGVQASDRYQLGAQVSGAVACGWLDQWDAADRAGDEDRKAQAAEALATSPTWPILLEMNDEGDYPEVVWEYSAAVNGGRIELPAGVDIVDYGPETVANGGYVPGLGCDLKR